MGRLQEIQELAHKGIQEANERARVIRAKASRKVAEMEKVREERHRLDGIYNALVEDLKDLEGQEKYAQREEENMKQILSKLTNS